MENVGQIYYRVPIIKPPGTDGENSTINYESNIDSIFNNNIVETYCGGANHFFSKVGIQAPPGTKIIMNKTGNKIIMIGRTGVYELDENINIDYMSFVQPIKYKLDQEATDNAMADGEEALRAAETYRKNALAALDETSETYWDDYDAIQKTYFDLYNDALDLYKRGVNGVYNNAGLGDLESVIIDFIYE